MIGTFAHLFPVITVPAEDAVAITSGSPGYPKDPGANEIANELAWLTNGN